MVEIISINIIWISYAHYINTEIVISWADEISEYNFSYIDHTDMASPRCVMSGAWPDDIYVRRFFSHNDHTDMASPHCVFSGEL